jgi:hypothetical protein
MTAELFDGRDSAHDDEAYLHWVAANPDGYVINTNRGINSGYMVLHRACCNDISAAAKYEFGAYTQRQYAKVCAESRDQLREWVKRNGRPDRSFSSEDCRCLRIP